MKRQFGMQGAATEMETNDQADKVRQFYNAHPYPAFGPSGIYAYSLMKRRLLQKLGIKRSMLRNKDILEAGCGTGESTLIYHYYHPRSITGIDISSRAIELAEENARELKIDAQFQVLDIQNLTPLDRHFDFIMCEVAHQTPDPGATVCELADHLRPGGNMVLSVASRWGNLGDTIRAWNVRILAGDDPERRLAVARLMFFNPFNLSTKCRGVKKRDFINLDHVIADIYLHPGRKNVRGSELMSWVDNARLRWVSSYPSINDAEGRASFWSRLHGASRLFFGDEYHLAAWVQKSREISSHG